MERITVDSFGSECPTNWEEIADFLNEFIDSELESMGDVDEREKRDAIDEIWERFCRGEIVGCPSPVFEVV